MRLRDNRPVAFVVRTRIPASKYDFVVEWHPGLFLGWGVAGDFTDGSGNFWPVALVERPDGSVTDVTADGGLYFLDNGDEWHYKPFEIFLNWIFPFDNPYYR